jgi:sugar lactone lactonase YvrE
MAHPSGVAVSPDGNVVYVSETMANRIVRFVKQKHGVFLSSELRLGFRV